MVGIRLGDEIISLLDSVDSVEKSLEGYLKSQKKDLKVFKDYGYEGADSAEGTGSVDVENTQDNVEILGSAVLQQSDDSNVSGISLCQNIPEMGGYVSILSLSFDDGVLVYMSPGHQDLCTVIINGIGYSADNLLKSHSGEASDIVFCGVRNGSLPSSDARLCCDRARMHNCNEDCEFRTVVGKQVYLESEKALVSIDTNNTYNDMPLIECIEYSEENPDSVELPQMGIILDDGSEIHTEENYEDAVRKVNKYFKSLCEDFESLSQSDMENKYYIYESSDDTNESESQVYLGLEPYGGKVKALIVPSDCQVRIGDDVFTPYSIWDRCKDGADWIEKTQEYYVVVPYFFTILYFKPSENSSPILSRMVKIY